MRKLKEVKDEVLSRCGRYVTASEKLKVKEVWAGDRRYLVCLNEEEQERERRVRKEMIAVLREKLAKDLKGLIGNRGYGEFLNVRKGEIELDEDRYDDKRVLQLCSKEGSGGVGI